MNAAWKLTGLLGCVLLFCPLNWLFRPALFLRQALWTAIITAGHRFGQSLRLLSLTVAIGLSFPLLFSALPPLLTTQPSLSHFWADVWLIVIVVLKVTLLPAVLIEWGTIRPWEQEIARSASHQIGHENSKGWVQALAETKSLLPRTWKISCAISKTQSHDFYEHWSSVARSSGLLLLHLSLISATSKLDDSRTLNKPYLIHSIFLLIMVIYLLKQILAGSKNSLVTFARLTLLTGVVYFSYTFVTGEILNQASGISVFFVFSILLALLIIEQMARFFIQVYDAQARLAQFSSGQWQLQLLNQSAKLGKIAVKHSNICIFLHLLDVLAAILRITVT